MEIQGKWIQTAENLGDVCPVFRKCWTEKKEVKEAVLYLTAYGVYEARLNEKRISSYVLAPGWTAYDKRLQYQRYDVTGLLKKENCVRVTLGKGWMRSPMPGWMETEDKIRRKNRPGAILGELHLTYTDGSNRIIATDCTWEYGESPVRFSEIYDGEKYDAGFETAVWKKAAELDLPMDILIPQEGEEIREMERVGAARIIRTPVGETVVDFGQEITGYVEFTVDAHAGDVIRLLHGEVLDGNGNFYNANYRSAKAEIEYICKEGVQTWHPALTFFGFRYLKLDEFVGQPKPEQFTAVAVYSAIRRTGKISCGNEALNQLFSNVFWGQKGNFLDVPTDCPQRDERLGWTGDAQVFVKAASYNYDVEKFFRKWLHDLAADQREDGSVGHVIPDYMPEQNASSAWGDAAVICPWQIYMTYGNVEVLADQFESMKKWVDYIGSVTEKEDLWFGGEHFGDWLGLDAPYGSYKGASREGFIASAFYAYSTELVIRAGKILGKDMKKYEDLYKRIVKAFREEFKEYRTQTEHVLALQFGLCEKPQETADGLARMLRENGTAMQTGFVGTPYILPVLSRYGYTELAYSLLLRKEYPSWLFSVEKGATTIWEHWDGIGENGEFWSTDMNSFNHYAYGAVVDWVYEHAAGITPAAPGFAKVRIAPEPDKRLGWLDVSIDTRYGTVRSRWIYTKEGVRYEITAPVETVIHINGTDMTVEKGIYTFWGK